MWLLPNRDAKLVAFSIQHVFNAWVNCLDQDVTQIRVTLPVEPDLVDQEQPKP